MPFLVLGGTALGTGRGEAVSPVLARPTTWHWVIAIADGGPVHPGGLPPSSTGCGPRGLAPAAARARRTSSWPRCASATRRCSPRRSATTCRRPRWRCGRSSPRRWTPGTDGRRARRDGLRLRADLRLPGRERGARGDAVAGPLAGAAALAGTALVAHRPGRRGADGSDLMANLVNLDRVTKAYGTAGTLLRRRLPRPRRQPIGSASSASTAPASRPCCGCSRKAEEPDSGRVTHRRDLRVLSLPQPLDLRAELTVRDVVLGYAWLPAEFAAEHEWAGDAGVRTVLDGLGMPLPRPGRAGRPDVRRRAPPGRARGAAGPRRPTCWSWTSPPTTSTSPASPGSPQHLLARRGALVVVTHDRWFLDAVCTRTWEVADETVRAYEGGYAAWMLARAERTAGGDRDRGPPAEPAAQGDRLAAPRPAGPDVASRSSGSTPPTR